MFDSYIQSTVNAGFSSTRAQLGQRGINLGLGWTTFHRPAQNKVPGWTTKS